MRISDWSSDVCSSDLVLQTFALLESDPYFRNNLKENILMRFNLFRFKPARPQITQVNLRPFLWALPLAAIAMACDSPKGDTGALDGEFIDQQLQAAIEQYKVMEERVPDRSEEHTSELQSLMRISYAVFCLKQKNKK